MAITQATDTELRTLIFHHPRVLVMFVTEKCPLCREMELFVKDCSDKIRYQEIYFFLMDASENPVSSKEVSLTGTPFFAGYKNGVLFYCSLLSTEEGVELLLSKLL